MRLLERKSDGDLTLTGDFVNTVPPYAILSHTWGLDNDEVTFRDMRDGTGRSKAGYAKARFCSNQAATDGLQYFWIDSCCIDKSSTAELTEAINSMFRWYHEAVKCYVYLSDVSTGNSDKNDELSQSAWKTAFKRCRWFTRGWTLQELIAPSSVEFFSREGMRLGDKRSMEQQVHEITGIAIQALQGSALSNFSAVERMSWVAKRHTMRKEDKAYCLLGIFDVHMPLIYGEGERAFIRLEEEIDKHSKSKQREGIERPKPLHARVLKTYREADVQTTRQELVAWSAMPRIFIVLAGVGRLDLMPAFVKAGVSDTWIPFDKQLIRQILSEPTTQDAFLENQLAVLNSSLSETEHQHFLDGHVHLEEIKGLGSGGFGSVSHVFDPQSGRNLAKKSIPRVRVVQNSRARDAVFVFERELAVLRRVSAVNHRHLVKIAGSYTDEHDFVILFTPVADMNLADYLENSASIPELQSWFGCLSTALLRLHDMKVRHKDIKPQNILVYQGTILLTDFGISYDWAEMSRPTTSGPGARDPRYCAPEVADWDSRNETSDIWSLGCVFLEMFSVIRGRSIREVREHFSQYGTSSTWYCKNSEALDTWLSQLAPQQSVTGEGAELYRHTYRPYIWIRQMLQFDKTARVHAKQLREMIVSPIVNGLLHDAGSFCGKCCSDQEIN